MIGYQYNELNWLTVKNPPSDPNIYFIYDVAGRVVEVNDVRDVSNGGGITRFKYDRLWRVAEVNDTEGRVVKYQYDERGNRTRLDYPNEAYLMYTYDELSRVTDINYNGLAIASYEYDELSRRSLVSLGNDTNVVYEYDIANKLTKITNNIDDETIVFRYDDYDKVGNRKSCKVDDANEQRYIYDSIYQLVNVDYNDAGGNETHYNYDKLGNRKAVNTSGDVVNYDCNSLNQYTSVDGTACHYDENGNLTKDGTYTYYYDYENRLIEVRNLAGTYTMAEYKYDFAGRRVRKITYPGVTAVTKYCYDGDQIIAEYAEQQQGDWQLSQYYYGPGIDEPICQGFGYNLWFLYYYDGLGNVVAISDGSDILERYEYDVYGKCIVHTSAGEDEIWMTEDDDIADYSVCNPFLFTGRQLDSETGLYYYRARHYHPEIGRFMQPDPIGYYDSMNLYQYCWNNPINYIDPFGLCLVPTPTPASPTPPTASGFPWGPFLRAAPGAFLSGAGQGLAAWGNGFIPFGNPFSGYYNSSNPTLRFSRAMGVVSRNALLAAAGLKAGGIGSKIGLHGPHHNFPLIGKQPHLQLNLWKEGVSGSGRAIRMPY